MKEMKIQDQDDEDEDINENNIEDDPRSIYKPLRYPYSKLKELDIYWGNKNIEKKEELKKKNTIKGQIKQYVNDVMKTFNPTDRQN